MQRKKIIIGCLTAFGVVVILCCAITVIPSFSNSLNTADTFTPDLNAISTAAFDTAVALRLQTIKAPIPTASATATETQIPLPTNTTKPDIPGAACIPDQPAQTGRVVHVVDGDTIKVMMDADGLTYSVRYIGMDTSETPGEYFATEAMNKNYELVGDHSIVLFRDVSETDQYGRLLRYVVADEKFVNYELVAQGYAQTVSYPPDTACIAMFQAAEQQAAEQKMGFWAIPPTIAPLPTAGIISSDLGASGNCNSYYPDVCLQNGIGDYDCAGGSGNGPNYVNGPIKVLPGDPYGLDRDGDGWGCE